MDLKPKLHQLSVEMMDILHAIKADPVMAVHSIRKSTKFLRAIINLLPEPDNDMRKSWKGISRSLAPYRDAHVLHELYQSLVAMSDLYPNTELSKRLVNDPYLLQAYPAQDELDELFKIVEKILRKIEGGDFEIDDSALNTKINKNFQKARVQFSLLLNDDGMPAVHALRKKVKRLWYQLRVKFGDPEESLPGTPLARTDALGQHLGYIHDLDSLNLRAQGEACSELIPQIRALRKSAFNQAIGESAILFSDDWIDLRAY